MRRNTALAARIAKLEAAHRPIRMPRLAFVVYGQDEAVTGFAGGQDGATIVERMPGEALSALSARAWAIIGGCSMWARYSQSVMDEPEAMPPEVEAMGWSEPEPTPAPDPAFPWHLSGIGRIATDEELAKMGVAPRRR